MFYGAAHEVTGSCTLIEACGRTVMVDCGMEQGQDIYENTDLPVLPGQVDTVLLTHAHIDHSGKIGGLAQPQGKAFWSGALCSAVYGGRCAENNEAVCLMQL